VSLAESAPRCWRAIQQGGTGEIKGVQEKVIFQNPGELNIVWFRGHAYVEKEGKLSLASDDVLAKLRHLETERGR